MMHFLRFLLAVFALPLSWALARSYMDVLKAIPCDGNVILSPGIWLMLAGVIAHLIVLWMFNPPVKVYVFGHELTHAIVALLFFARVSNFRVRSNGGSVSVSKSNLLITLSPYFFPFYTIIVALLAMIVRCFTDELPLYWLWLFAIGYTWCFHVCFTIRSIIQEQPDLREYGYLFSYVLIWIFNVVGVSLWIICTTGVPWSCFFRSVISRTASAYTSLWNAGAWCYELICSLPILQG